MFNIAVTKSSISLDPKIFDELETYGQQLRKVEDRTVRDLGKRAPSWIAQEVSKEYNIKKGELTQAGKGTKKPWGEGNEYFNKAGVGHSSGETLASFSIEYKGRLLTPFHFGMTPKARPVGRAYTIRAAVKKGSKKELGKYTRKRTRGGPYSSKTGALFMVNGGSVPGVRNSHNRKDIDVWKTLSVPQMVGNDNVQNGYNERLTSEVSALLEKYGAMYIK